VDSPGGSFVASDTIWRETVRAREANKPVIVSMGNLAGSGGYYVAMHADKIVAQPGTITASIGVYGGKFLTRKLWDRVGVTWDDVHTSARSQMWSARYDWSVGGDRFNAMLDRVYADFTGKVAEGRGIPLEDVLDFARGRIWTGEDALELGLVDELGGMDVAIRLAREAAGIDVDEPIRLKQFPRPRTAFEALFERGGSVDSASLSAIVSILRKTQPAVRTLSRIGLVTEEGVLTMPDVVPSY
jgi:protease-4